MPTLQIIRTVVALRGLLDTERNLGKRIGLVPTMGAFHAGHLALMREAGTGCDVIVVSLFVNPTQFDDANDLTAYPRNEARDAALAEQAGVHVLFAPAVQEVYPVGFNSVVNVGGVTQPLEGKSRGAAHFPGVATVVTKLCNMVQPQVAYFGQKDVQQTRVIRKLVRDLNIPVQIAVVPTVREADGLAMSSRNVRLSPDARGQAVALYRALTAVQRAVDDGERDTGVLVGIGLQILRAHNIPEQDVEYFAAVDDESLEPIREVQRTALFVVAVWVGGVRLIDNISTRAT